MQHLDLIAEVALPSPFLVQQVSMRASLDALRSSKSMSCGPSAADQLDMGNRGYWGHMGDAGGAYHVRHPGADLLLSWKCHF